MAEKTILKVQVLVYRLTPSPEYLLLQRPPEFNSLWQPITGHVEAGETEEEAARREVSEEIGVTATSIISLGEPFSFQTRGNTYVERAYAAEIRDKPLTLSKEHVNCCWVFYTEARKLLPYQTQRNFLDALEEKLRGK